MNIGRWMTVVCVNVCSSRGVGKRKPNDKGRTKLGRFCSFGLVLWENVFTYLTPNLAATRFHCDKPLNLRAATLWTSRNGFFRVRKK